MKARCLQKLLCYFSQRLEAFVLYYIMGVLVPSLHRESTDSLIVQRSPQLQENVGKDCSESEADYDSS